MFVECRQYLVDKLGEAGIRTPVITSEKKLQVYTDSHVGAVLFMGEAISRSGSKRIYEDERSGKHKRRKVFDRTIEYAVTIGEYTQDKAEAIYEAFLQALDRGLYIDGNYTYLDVVEAQWTEKDDAILRAQVGVIVLVRFVGGVYREVDLLDVRNKELDIKVEVVRKESLNG